MARTKNIGSSSQNASCTSERAGQSKRKCVEDQTKNKGKSSTRNLNPTHKVSEAELLNQYFSDEDED